MRKFLIDSVPIAFSPIIVLLGVRGSLLLTYFEKLLSSSNKTLNRIFLPKTL
jgi:hypothetical protein